LNETLLEAKDIAHGTDGKVMKTFKVTESVMDMPHPGRHKVSQGTCDNVMAKLTSLKYQ
jgi:hypothetical protein